MTPFGGRSILGQAAQLLAAEGATRVYSLHSAGVELKVPPPFPRDGREWEQWRARARVSGNRRLGEAGIGG